jgi:hypothetical protein
VIPALIGLAGALAAAVVSVLLGLGLRALWRLAEILQEDRDATRANTVALEKLTRRVDAMDARATGRRRTI